MKSELIKMVFALVVTGCILIACGEKKSEQNAEATEMDATATQNKQGYDPNRGIGKWTPQNINISATLDEAMAEEGEQVYNAKCASCHKLTTDRPSAVRHVVGPGWQGVTNRRTPEWIMNFITNPEPMILNDPAVQGELTWCNVRMPNEQLTDLEARALFEFMRKNDGVK